MTWQIYMLRCADNSLYTGVTTDIERRLSEHNESKQKGAKYTRARRPVELVYTEDVDSRAQACQREAQIKALSRKQKLHLIEQGTP